ncbi:MAG: glycosyltransferase [Salinivirgaceae bacterium]|nr:glycosyltransferase [Salinivirgaceae bacterium]
MTYTIASLVFLAVSLAYAMLIIRIRFGFKKIAAQPRHSGANLAVSILVPFHNEEGTIQSTLESILSQQTNADFEVIAIDDYSTDGSRGVVSAMLAANPRLRLIEANDRGKKNALTEAIAAARFNAIITADADCTYPQGWLDAMAATFSHEKCALLAAPMVLSPASSWFQKFQFVDFASLVGSGIGAAGCRRPIMCNGANLMFDRLEYNKLTDPLNSKIASGDDVFLLHKMKAAGAKISFTAQPETIATTRPAPSVGAFLRQRTRWGGKATGYTDADSLIVAALVTLESVLLCIGIAALPLLWKPAIILYLTKLIADTLLLTAVCKQFGNRRLLWWMPVFEFVVVLYTIVVAAAAVFGIGKKKWK